MEKIHLGCVKHNISMKRGNIVGMRECECNDAMPWAALSSPYPPSISPPLFSSIFPISHQPDRLNWMLCWMRSPSPISSLPFSFPNLSPISFVCFSPSPHLVCSLILITMLSELLADLVFNTKIGGIFLL